ncbi:hypothetical protein SDC9_71309 [bioreactor metagenome]|uniref:NAD-specific glutamate dehydrogenase n=1 Tax=bioreactor metagenome TaxID=1076179 RepID=A0A644YE65_9ZZZZ
MSVPLDPLKAHHFVGDAVDRVFHGGLSRHEGLLNVRLRGQMRTAALQKAQLDAPDLGAGLLLDDCGKRGGKAAKLGVTEPVGGGGLRLGDKGAVWIVDPLGHGHHAVALFLVDALHVGQKFFHIELRLRQVDQVGTRTVGCGQRGRAGKPAGMAAHNFNDADHSGVIDPGVLINLHAACGDILGGRGVSGAVVRAIQVVVDGLGHAHHAALISCLLHILGDFVAGVHRVVSAVIEEIAHVILLKRLQNALVVGVVHIRVRHFVAAGAKGGGGGVFQKLQFCRVLLAHVEQAVVQNAFDAVLRAINRSDGGRLQRGGNHAVRAGVDHRSGTSGLAQNAGAFQFTHG